MDWRRSDVLEGVDDGDRSINVSVDNLHLTAPLPEGDEILIRSETTRLKPCCFASD
ncbi:hypothetical protein [Calothrix rhizosoleniae]|uniref:hypothetical protein n=1 Tax=Calothrix rhizosoleniae TaxID=888997 RepID=UPI0013563E01|nr:hypothetical protein [Calothrix rhizosoleniae]